MKIALLGFDRQGRSAYDYWHELGNDITICDQNLQIDTPTSAQTQLGDNYLADLGQFDVLVRTPGLHPSKITQANPQSPHILDKVTTVTNEFMRVCPSKNIIGVTGTKGKGTTSTLIAHILKASGYRVHLGGNIGIAPLELLSGAGLFSEQTEQNSETQGIQPDDWVVLELANYQLIDCKYSPRIGVCLMVEPEHLDWHQDLDEYLRAKQQMFLYQKPEDTAIFHAHNNRSRHIATSSPGIHVPFMTAPGAEVINENISIDGEIICRTTDIPLLGNHNQENVCAAVSAVWQITQNSEIIKQGIVDTKPLPCRIEEIATVHKVVYINDSFATNPSATIAAVKAVRQPKTLLLGGYDRGLDFSELAHTIANPDNLVSRVILFGQTQNKIEKSLQQMHFKNTTKLETTNMEEIVKVAQQQSNPGDAVVLSPACASFDMFKNFEVRGEAFNVAVGKL